jgi:hypothetical protein
MTCIGFNFGDPTTWTRCLDGTDSPNSLRFTFTKDEKRLIATEIAPVFVCPVDIAVEAVTRMVRLAAMKARRGAGMSREYRRALLTDLGINAQENTKLARCWDVVAQAGFIELSQKGFFRRDGSAKGKANTYVVGSRMKDRVYPNWHQAALPPWLNELDGTSPPADQGEPDATPDPEWAEWTRRLLQLPTHKLPS